MAKAKYKYDEKIKVNASFNDMVSKSVAGNPKPKAKKKAVKKK